MEKKLTLGIVLPCYNESFHIEKTLNELDNQIKILFNKEIIDKVVVCIVDDGSMDDTWKKIIDLKKNIVQFSINNIIGIKFSKNFGHQYALLAGISNLKDKVDCILSVDSDLEQDIKILPDFLKEFIKGNEIVLGVRKNRKSTSIFKTITSKIFYKIANLLKINLETDHADYRLISSRVAKEISLHGEYYVFLRGLIKNIGFKTSRIYYEEQLQSSRNSRYSKIKMLELAIDGITSFSVFPIRVLSILGFLIVVF